MGVIVEAETPLEALTNFHKSDWVKFEGYEINPIEYYLDKDGNSSNVAEIKLKGL